jgi:hypothetical protein
MRATNRMVANIKADSRAPIRSSNPSPSLVPTGRHSRRVGMPERWVVDLVGLALVGVLLGAAAVAGLAAVSAWVPTQAPPAGKHVLIGDEAGGAIYADLSCCGEMR